MSCASYLSWCRKKSQPGRNWVSVWCCLIRGWAKSNCLIIIFQSIFHFRYRNCSVIAMKREQASIIARRTATVMDARIMCWVFACPLPLPLPLSRSVWSFCLDKCMINYFIICKLVFSSLSQISLTLVFRCILWGAATIWKSWRWNRCY